MKPIRWQHTRWIHHFLIVALFFVFAVAPVVAETVITITQVDPSDFPEMVVYLTITDESGSNISGLTKEMFIVTEDGQPTRVIDFAGDEQVRPVDIVFAFDTTGSMQDEIHGLKDTAIRFAGQLQDNGRDFRLGLVTFGDEIREVHNRNSTLTDSAEEFRSWVSRLIAEGGGDDPEISLDALHRASEMRFRPDAQKVLILITDADPHEFGDGTPFSNVVPGELFTRLYNQGFTVYAVGPDHPHYRQVADETTGQFFDIARESDFTGIIERLGGIIAAQYRLTYLSPRPANDGTRRTIAIEVGGQTVVDDYLEPHLVNIESDLTVGLIFLAPLLVALALPWLVEQWPARRMQSRPEEGVLASLLPPPPTPVQQAQHASTPQHCSKCDAPLRPGAKFCGRCGQPTALPTSPQTAAPAQCPACGEPAQSDSRFCSHCGQWLS